MEDIVNIDTSKEMISRNDNEISVLDEMLQDVRSEMISKEEKLVLPISELSVLGSGVSSLIPEFNKLTQTMSVNTQGLFKLANASYGDTLKVAKNGNFWGAYKKVDGGSKFVQLKPVDSVTATQDIVMNANPATMMMAVALFSIEKELGNIAEMEKQIISFLEIEKEAEIEADVITLSEIIMKYKHNWDNEMYIESNHKMVCDIQRTARKNMIAFQKQVVESLKLKQLIVVGSKINNILDKLLRKFKYYRLSLYTFSLSILVEIMLSGNFKEEYILSAIDEIRKNSDEYRTLFAECSFYLENMSNKSLKMNMLKGVGTVSNSMGKMISNIPKMKNKIVDEFLIEKGDKIRNEAQEVSRDTIEAFANVSNPNTSGFINKLEDMNIIYNKTKEICMDKNNLYLIVG